MALNMTTLLARSGLKRHPFSVNPLNVGSFAAVPFELSAVRFSSRGTFEYRHVPIKKLARGLWTLQCYVIASEQKSSSCVYLGLHSQYTTVPQVVSK